MNPAVNVNRALSAKQWEIMEHLMRGNPDGTWLDFDELLAKCSYKPSKESMHFSLRSLVTRGLIEKKPTEFRRGQHRRILAPTALAYEKCRR